MKKAWLIGGAIVLLVLLIVAVPFLVPAGQYRASLEKAATQSLGRDVKVNGDLRFTLLPRVGLTARQVTIANLAGGKAAQFAQIDALDVGVSPAALLGGRVEVTQLILKRPILALEADVGGKPNWLFEPKPDAAIKTAEQKAKELEKVGFGDLRVEQGTLSYLDKQGKLQQLSTVNAKIAFKSINAPLKLTSDFVYNNDPVKVVFDAPAPRAFVEEKPMLMNVAVDSAKLTLKLAGAIDPKTMAITGKLDAKGPSLRQLAAWTGSPIGKGGGFEGFAVVGDLKAEGPRTALNNVSLAIDKARGRGNVVILDRGKQAPFVAANVILEALDVNPYLAAPDKADASAQGGPKGINVQQGWDQTRIDLAGLKAVDGDLTIKTGQLTFQKMKIDRADLQVMLRGGYMRTTMKTMALYGGVGSGVLILDARGEGLRIQNRLTVNDINAKAFLADAIGLDRIEGKAEINVDFSGVGLSQQSIMNTLSGAASFNFEDGALVGVNLAQIARQVQSALTGAAIGPAAKTDFAELAADFTIARGVANTKSLRMLNPFIRIVGEGDINLAEQTLNMKITPRAVKSIEGQGGKQDITGVGVPFRVSGPWSKPNYKPDLLGVVQENFSKQIDDLSKNLGGLFGQKTR